MVECTHNINCQKHLIKRPTPRPLLALAYASIGYNVYQTSEAMRVGKNWIEYVLRMARYDLGAANTKHAIALAYAHGILPIEGVEI